MGHWVHRNRRETIKSFFEVNLVSDKTLNAYICKASSHEHLTAHTQIGENRKRTYEYLKRIINGKITMRNPNDSKQMKKRHCNEATINIGGYISFLFFFAYNSIIGQFRSHDVSLLTVIECVLGCSFWI